MSQLPIPARNLDASELEALVNELALQPERWSQFVSFSDQERHFVSLYRDDHVDVWLLCWTPRNDTGWHDHDISSGAVRVVDGELLESSPRIGGEAAARTVGTGQSFSFGPDHIHRLAGHGNFVRVRRSAIINLRALATLERYGKGTFVVRLRNGTNIISSRYYQPGLRQLLAPDRAT